MALHFGDGHWTEEERDHEADNIRDLDPGRYSERPHWQIISAGTALARSPCEAEAEREVRYMCELVETAQLRAEGFGWERGRAEIETPLRKSELAA